MLPTPSLTPGCFFQLWDQWKCKKHMEVDGTKKTQAPLPPRPCQRSSAILKSAGVARVVTICRLDFPLWITGEPQAESSQEQYTSNQLNNHRPPLCSWVSTNHQEGLAPQVDAHAIVTLRLGMLYWIHYKPRPLPKTALPAEYFQQQIWISKQLAQEMVPFLNRWSWDF